MAHEIEAAGHLRYREGGEVLPVAMARASLPQILRRFRACPDTAPVFVGSHRKADGVLMPVGQYRNISAHGRGPQSVLGFIRHRRRLILRLAALSHIQAVAVFGSAARGEETPDSDVDFVVDPDEEASLFDLAQFADDMESLLARPVDVVSRRSLDAQRDRAIIAEAVPL